MISLREKEYQEISAILDKYFKDLNIWVFGSRITPHVKNYSDLDLVIKKDSKVDFKLLLRAINDFEESSLNFKVDLLDFHRLDESFKQIVIENHEVFSLSNLKN